MKQFVATAAICIGIALLILRFPSCMPRDVSNCTWDLENKTYICPEDK